MDETAKKLAELQDQVDTLRGETFAFHMILGRLTKALADASPETLAVVRLAFDQASGYAEDITIQLGISVSPKHTAQALNIVEKMCAVALRGHIQPRHGV